jgi:hypothetical protein
LYFNQFGFTTTVTVGIQELFKIFRS